ncbi:hypothetical protein AVEN_265790-1 [Araneus ventricosus]|uniref:Uncharacterized protein n=1 Tax=Araneus ventricosus TaxID=182803 RepID=A0A4Y2MWP0_ARAVE|nr:hypothetical protein AVEN_265790-1 [Araneus ventricosus]
MYACHFQCLALSLGNDIFPGAGGRNLKGASRIRGGPLRKVSVGQRRVRLSSEGKDRRVTTSSTPEGVNKNGERREKKRLDFVGFVEDYSNESGLRVTRRKLCDQRS